MNIVLWIVNEPNQYALVNRIHAKFPLAGIVTESRTVKRKLTAKLIVEKVYEKLFLSSIGKAWFGMLNHYRERYPSLPDVPVIDVENINSDEVVAFTKQLEPDLIVVSGTRLIRKKLMSIPVNRGIINLHTGLSPYVKGGPNCTNWCLAEGKYHLIGNTIMWIDAGIDTGNIIATEFTEFVGDESLLQLHLKVMDHAHDLYVRAIGEVLSGKAKNIPQSQLGGGITYYTKQWGIKEKFRLVKNMSRLKEASDGRKLKALRKDIKTVPLELHPKHG